MISVLENLGLDDRHKSVLLADGSVSGEVVGIFSDSDIAGHSVANLEDSSPLGKSASHLVVLGAPLAKSVESLCGGLLVSSSDDLKPSVDLNSAVDASALKDLSELLTVFAGVSYGFVKHDDSADVLLNSGGGEEEFSVVSSVVVVVLNVDSVEPLSNGSSGLVGGEDSLSGGGNLFGGLDEFFLEVS